MDVQRNLESAVEKRSREIFGAPPGKKLIVFIDDMNMPFVDIYGTQQPIAFLKLLFERGGFYDRGRDLNWKYLRDLCKYCEECLVSNIASFKNVKLIFLVTTYQVFIYLLKFRIYNINLFGIQLTLS